METLISRTFRDGFLYSTIFTPNAGGLPEEQTDYVRNKRRIHDRILELYDSLLRLELPIGVFLFAYAEDVTVVIVGRPQNWCSTNSTKR